MILVEQVLFPLVAKGPSPRRRSGRERRLRRQGLLELLSKEPQAWPSVLVIVLKLESWY